MRRVFTRVFMAVVFIGLLTTMMTSCNKQLKKNSASINVILEDVDLRGLLYIKELNVRGVAIKDSIKVSNKGRFSFNFHPDSAGFYIIGYNDDNFITLQTEPGENVVVTLKSQLFKSNYKIKGSAGSEILKSYFDHNQKNKLKVDSLGIIYKNARETENFATVKQQLDEAYKLVLNDERLFTEKLIRSNPSKLTSVFLLNQSFGPALLFNEADDIALFQLVDSMVINKYPSNKHALDHHQRVIELTQRIKDKAENDKRLSVGQAAPEISLKDVSGKEFNLKDQNSKVTILYFWQSMCGQCRKDNLALKDFYKINKSYGLNLWMLSLDENPEMTNASVKLDKVGGSVFLVKGGFNDLVSKRYNITQDLPVYYIIGKDGRISGKGNSLDEIKETVHSLLTSKK